MSSAAPALKPKENASKRVSKKDWYEAEGNLPWRQYWSAHGKEMDRRGLRGWAGTKKSLSAAGKGTGAGAALGGAAGAGVGAYDAIRHGRDLKRSVQSGAAAGATLGGVAGLGGGLAYDNARFLHGEQKSHDKVLKQHGLTTGTERKKGLAGKLGLKKRTYHMTSEAKEQYLKPKEASSSLEEARALCARIANGDLGDSMKTAFSGLSLALEQSCATTSATKEAVADDTVNETDEEARKRRLAELLKRREPSGLATGSATPTPPRDNA